MMVMATIDLVYASHYDQCCQVKSLCAYLDCKKSVWSCRATMYLVTYLVYAHYYVCNHVFHVATMYVDPLQGEYCWCLPGHKGGQAAKLHTDGPGNDLC